MPSILKEVGKVIINENQFEIQVNFTSNFNNKPSIKLTTNENTNVYLEDVQTTHFKINTMSPEQIEVHYIAIEGPEGQ